MAGYIGGWRLMKRIWPTSWRCLRRLLCPCRTGLLDPKPVVLRTTLCGYTQTEKDSGSLSEVHLWWQRVGGRHTGLWFCTTSDCHAFQRLWPNMPPHIVSHCHSSGSQSPFTTPTFVRPTAPANRLPQPQTVTIEVMEQKAIYAQMVQRLSHHEAYCRHLVHPAGPTERHGAKWT